MSQDLQERNIPHDFWNCTLPLSQISEPFCIISVSGLAVYRPTQIQGGAANLMANKNRSFEHKSLFTQSSGPLPTSLSMRLVSIALALLPFLGQVLAPANSFAGVSHGSADLAKSYYRSVANEIGFSTPDKVLQTTLDDVAAYLGYAGITGADLQNLPSDVLMDPDRLLAPCATPSAACANTLRNRDAVLASVGATPLRSDDILASRFFAPKIVNINLPEPTRPLGWRKLIRLRARPGSSAQAHQIASGIILFNFFTNPGTLPFGPGAESVNTQVMLITSTSSVPAPNNSGPATLYWLDYGPLLTGGTVSLALNASFDANALPASSNGVQPYFVPAGCVACHGESGRRSMVNYLDTDHWFDRLDNDFQALKSSGLPLLVDAQTNDDSSAAYKLAFDVIHHFNEEADAEARKAQPKHDETLAAQKWLELHTSSYTHFSPIQRVIGDDPKWSNDDPNDVKLLTTLNQYCFRCHGSVRFSVFNKQGVRLRRPLIQQSIRAGAPTDVEMPTDRPLTDDLREYLLNSIPQ